MNKPDFHFGDLVMVGGYGARIFQVDAYSKMYYYSPEIEYDDLTYELTAVDNGEFLIADEEDMALVADAGQADEYLRANPSAEVRYLYGVDYAERVSVMKAKEPPKPTAKELSSQEAERRKQERKEKAAQIDNLLDMRRWYAASDALDAGERIAEIDGELRKVSEIQE